MPGSLTLSKIGTEIRKAQREMRGAIKGAPKATQRKLRAKIRKLQRYHAAIKRLCGGSWNPRY